MAFYGQKTCVIRCQRKKEGEKKKKNIYIYIFLNMGSNCLRIVTT